MPADSLADLLSFDKHILAAYRTLLEDATPPFAVYALSNDETTYPSVSMSYEAGEVPRRFITPTAGPLAGKRLADHRPGTLTFVLKTDRTQDDHAELLGLLLATLEDANDDLPALLPYYAIVEARQLGAPITTQDDRETVTTLTWQFDLFILPSAVPTTPTAIGYYTNRNLSAFVTTYGTDTAMLDVNNPAGPTYERNASIWMSGVDLSGIPLYTGPTTRARGILITPRHLLTANHFPPLVGAPVHFLSTEDEVVVRTVTAIRSISGSDAAIAVLSADVPEGVRHYKIAPTDIDYQAGFGIAVDGQSKLLALTMTPGAVNFTHAAITSGTLAPVSEALGSGDSGAPMAYFLSDELVVLGTAFSATTSPLAAVVFDDLVDKCAAEGHEPELFDATDYIV